MVETNKSSTFASLLRKQGAWAGRLGNGLQNRVEQFDSARHLIPAMNFKNSSLVFIPNAQPKANYLLLSLYSIRTDKEFKTHRNVAKINFYYLTHNTLSNTSTLPYLRKLMLSRSFFADERKTLTESQSIKKYRKDLYATFFSNFAAIYNSD